MLQEIYAHKRQEVDLARGRISFDAIRERAAAAPLARGFCDSLENSSRPALIAEVKKASPSKGVIRAEFDPVAIAQSYEGTGATCLSVLTDERYFQGSSENLVKCREATALPVLRKDFIFDPYQVYESRAMGADAILLIVAMLADGKMRELQALSGELGMDTLVEVHDVSEVERALAIEAKIIGVNNRDLSTFKKSLTTSERLLPMIGGRAITVSESAIETSADVGRVAAAGADAVLIGTTFCAAPDVEAKVREVMGW